MHAHRAGVDDQLADPAEQRLAKVGTRDGLEDAELPVALKKFELRGDRVQFVRLDVGVEQLGEEAQVERCAHETAHLGSGVLQKRVNGRREAGELFQLGIRQVGDAEVAEVAELGVDVGIVGNGVAEGKELADVVVVTEVEAPDGCDHRPLWRVAAHGLDQVEQGLLGAVAAGGVERIDEQDTAFGGPVFDDVDDVAVEVQLGAERSERAAVELVGG